MLTPRWYKLRPHDVQRALWHSKARFVVLPCGRRSGKSEIARRKLVLSAIDPDTGYDDPNYFIAAPTRDQAKRIHWKALKDLLPPLLVSRISESELSIQLYNGATIYVVGMDKPERIEGIAWNGGILDEYANMKQSAWEENVRPALSDRNGWCWLIGVPEGRNHYYDTYMQAMQDTTGEWAVFQWPSADILPPEEIESARRALDELTFRQEMQGDFVSFAGRAYYNFDVATHVSSALSYNEYAPLVFCFDFNVSPGVAVVLQEQVLPGCFDRLPNPRYFRGPTALADALASDLPDAFVRKMVTGTGVIGEVHIARNSTTPAVCNRLIADWGDHKGEIHCYGDASGGAKGTAKTQGSDWELIDQHLRAHYGNRVQLFIPRANPPERTRVNAMNARLKNADGRVSLLVDCDCKNLIKDLDGVRLLDGGSGEIDKRHDPKLTHMCFAAGTMLNGHPIADLPAYGMVNTVFGPRAFDNPGLRGLSELIEITFANGAYVRCTPDHLILTTDGWKAAMYCYGKWALFVDRPLFERNTPPDDIDRDMAAQYAMQLPESYFVRVTCVQALHMSRQLIYCPTVQGGHFCLDNGLVVSNSDALGYYVQYEFPVHGNSDLVLVPVANRY